MSDKLAEMWARLEEHQPRADQRGYGDAWRVMCEQRTPAAAWEAEVAAWAAADGVEAAAKAADAARVAGRVAAWAAMLTANASAAWAAEAWAAEAIESINKSEASDEQN
jgi:hypothetical protein